jgi:hypothetical protein
MLCACEVHARRVDVHAAERGHAASVLSLLTPWRRSEEPIPERERRLIVLILGQQQSEIENGIRIVWPSVDGATVTTLGAGIVSSALSGLVPPALTRATTAPATDRGG